MIRPCSFDTAFYHSHYRYWASDHGIRIKFHAESEYCDEKHVAHPEVSVFEHKSQKCMKISGLGYKTQQNSVLRSERALLWAFLLVSLVLYSYLNVPTGLVGFMELPECRSMYMHRVNAWNPRKKLQCPCQLTTHRGVGRHARLFTHIFAWSNRVENTKSNS